MDAGIIILPFILLCGITSTALFTLIMYNILGSCRQKNLPINNSTTPTTPFSFSRLRKGHFLFSLSLAIVLSILFVLVLIFLLSLLFPTYD